ncbi:MAG: NADPH-dependent F420 reductase [Pseudonocardiaceae bacterium]
MKIGIIGAGRIGGNAARMLTRVGHEVLVSFSRDPYPLPTLAAELGDRAQVGTAAEAATFGPVVMISVPWPAVDIALSAAGSLAGKIVIDTTHQFILGGLDDLGTHTAAQLNHARMPGARLVKAFNTLTAGFQAETAGRAGADRVVIFLCGDDAEAKAAVAGLIDDAGFIPVDLGGLADAAAMEAPRPGAVYGEEYHET